MVGAAPLGAVKENDMPRVSKKLSLKVGDRVGTFVDEWGSSGEFSTKPIIRDDAGPEYGEVIDFNGASQVVVQWDNEFMNPKYSTQPISVLLYEDEMKARHSAIEKEFDKVSTEIRAKMKEAGKLLREANKLAKKQGQQLADMYDATDPLYSAMDACGWRTSSFDC